MPIVLLLALAAVLNQHAVVTPKLHPAYRAVRVAHVALAPGPAAMTALAAAKPDVIVYTGPAAPVGDAFRRLVGLAVLAPTFGVRDERRGDPFVGTGIRVLDAPMHLELGGQDLGLACAEGPTFNWAGLVSKLPSRDTFNIIAARNADGFADPALRRGKGCDLFLAATAGQADVPMGRSRQHGLDLHVAGGGAATLFALKPPKR